MSGREAILAALPEYEIGGELGRGGFGVVLSGRHRQLRREVAIKELPSALAADPRVRARFAAEARVLASLSHPHIVPIYDYVERDGLCLLVMEKLTGGTLWDQFKTHGLSVETTCAVAMAACTALHYAHQRGVLHRDIKPENLLYSSEGVLKITDFGIAKVVGGGETLATRGGEILGTPAYMAPEQAEGRELGPPADVYATGIMLYELLSGELPYSEEGGALAIVYRHVYEEPIPLSKTAPNLEPALAAVAMRSIARSPADRYATAEAFGIAIGETVTPLWGPAWLERAGMQIVDSGPIAESAKRPTGSTTGYARAGKSTILSPPVGTSAPPPLSGGVNEPGSGGARVDDQRPAGTGGQEQRPVPPGPMSGGDFPIPADSVDIGDRSFSAPADLVPRPEGAAPLSIVTPEVWVVPSAAIVRPQADDHVIGGAGENYVAGVSFVPIRKVIELPPPPYALGATALVLFLITIAVALLGVGKPKFSPSLPPSVTATVGKGDPTKSATIKLDLGNPIPVALSNLPANVTSVQVGFSIAGIPLPPSAVGPVTRATNTATASVGATTDRYLVGGTVTGDLRLLDVNGATVADQKFLARGKQPPFLTVPGGLLIALFLFVAAYMESLLRPLRRGRRTVSGVAGMTLLGVALGVLVVGIMWQLGNPETTVTTLIICAACGAGTGVTTALAAVRIGRRARIRPKKGRQLR
jgi:serine/threonine-protein kinase